MDPMKMMRMEEEEEDKPKDKMEAKMGGDKPEGLEDVLKAIMGAKDMKGDDDDDKMKDLGKKAMSGGGQDAKHVLKKIAEIISEFCGEEFDKGGKPREMDGDDDDKEDHPFIR